ncbi:2-hydroxyacid dehydrogenase [Zopfochytrium polystomum]|nr:2-hydroxyacid dehydrogenase [Zopfochytrium polystomum]
MTMMSTAAKKHQVLFLSASPNAAKFVEGVRAAVAELAPNLIDIVYPVPDDVDRAAVEILVTNLWAGVDSLLVDPTFPKSPMLVRMIDPFLTRSMNESVLMHVLNIHRFTYTYLAQQRESKWVQFPHGFPAHAHERTVAVIGTGELGMAAITVLAQLEFKLVGWSRTAKTRPDHLKDAANVRFVHGADGMDVALGEADIVINLLPHTPSTHHMFAAETFAKMKRGAAYINLGRGKTVKEVDLVKALDDGTVGLAVLDVYEVEPLPAGSPLWTHPRCIVYPHIAATPNPKTACRVIVETIIKYLNGERNLAGLVDHELGY